MECYELMTVVAQEEKHHREKVWPCLPMNVKELYATPNNTCTAHLFELANRNALHLLYDP